MKDFLRHSKAIRFLDEVVEVDVPSGTGTFSLTLAGGKRYWDADGVFDEVWLIEVLAQAAAGLFYFQGENGQQAPRVGYLVSIDQFKCYGDSRQFAVGDQLRVSVRMTTEFFPFGVYEGSIWRDDQLVADGEMKFLIDDSGGLGR